jgi:hypothetical protein
MIDAIGLGVTVALGALLTAVSALLLLALLDAMIFMYVRRRTERERAAVKGALFECAYALAVHEPVDALTAAALPRSVRAVFRASPITRFKILRAASPDGEVFLWEAERAALLRYLTRRLDGTEPRLGAVVWLGAGYETYVLRALCAHAAPPPALLVVDTAEVLNTRQPHDAAAAAAAGKLRVAHVAHEARGTALPEGGVAPALQRALAGTGGALLVLGGVSACGFETRDEAITTLRALRFLAATRPGSALVVPFAHGVTQAGLLRTHAFASFAEGGAVPVAAARPDAVLAAVREATPLTVRTERIEAVDLLVVTPELAAAAGTPPK